MTISSADPDELRRYVAAGRALNERARKRLGALLAQYEAYAAKPCDYPVSMSGVLAGLRGWVELNGQDDRWVETVAQAFEAADADGGPVLADDAAIAALLLRSGVRDGPRAGIAGLGTPPVPASRDPAVIARWWEWLTPAQRTALLADDPKLIGGLAGVPTRWRDKANRIALRQRIEALAAERGAVAAQVAALERLVRSGEADLDAAADLLAAQRRLAGIARRLAGCVNLERQLEVVAREPRNRLHAGEVFLLDFDADFAGGDGRAVVALGDPATAEHVGVVVPGTGSTLGNVEGPLSNAARLRATVDEDLGPAAAQRTATVMWLGYDTPDSIPDAVNKSEAEAGGSALGAFVGELRAAHGGPSRPHVSVFGHSYGSTVVGMAAGQGVAADDVVLYASPGAGADHASELAVPSGHVWAARTDNDPIRFGKGLAGLDADPMGEDFGARRVPVDPPPQQSGHSGYYEWHSSGLLNFARILTGRHDEVG